MITLHIIAPSVTEASPGEAGLGSPLGGAARALATNGFFASLPGLGAEVEGISYPEPIDPARVADPIERLGAFNAQIAAGVAAAIGRGARPFLAGGTCSHLPGMIGGLQQAYGPTARLGLVWLDAHGDFNTPRTSYSQMLGGMPVAVVAGLCYPAWREGAGIEAPIPTDRILMVDVRNLDDREEVLIRATDVAVARFGPGGAPGEILAAIDTLASRVELLYLHIDADILDASLQPNHPTAESDGPDSDAVDRIIEHAMSTRKVAAFGVVSINPQDPGGTISLESGQRMMRTGIQTWAAAGANV